MCFASLQNKMGCFTFVKVVMVLFNLLICVSMLYFLIKCLHLSAGRGVLRRIIAFFYSLTETFMWGIKNEIDSACLRMSNK